MTIFRCSLLACGLLAGCATAGVTGQEEAAAVATGFCAAVKAFREDEAERLMTAGLRARIAELRRFDAEWQRRNPGEKPPLGNGLMLKAWQDAPESCTPEQVSASGAVLLYAPAGAPADVWRDRLVLVRGADGRLQVADIVYDPRTGGKFTSWLREALDSQG